MVQAQKKDETSNYEWLAERVPLTTRAWHDDLVIRKYEVDNYKFYRFRNNPPRRQMIDLSQVKGIEYGYAYNCSKDITWIELLNELHRFDDIRKNKTTHASLVEHALSSYLEPKTVEKYGDTLITIGGQHRMALCKFLELGSVEATVIEHSFNAEAYEAAIKKVDVLKFLVDKGVLTETEYHKQNAEHYNFVTFECGEGTVVLDRQFYGAFIERYQSMKTMPLNFLVDYLKNISFFDRPHSSRKKIGDLESFNRYRSELRKMKQRVMH